MPNEHQRMVGELMATGMSQAEASAKVFSVRCTCGGVMVPPGKAGLDEGLTYHRIDEPCFQRDRSGKVDHGKVPAYAGLIQSFPRALQAIAEHTAKGAAEPGHHWHGWKEAQDGYKRYSNAFIRHLLTEGAAGPTLANVTATCWNDLARLEHLLMEAEGDIDDGREA